MKWKTTRNWNVFSFFNDLCWTLSASLIIQSSTANFRPVIKGQLISKASCQAVNSSKKRTNEFVFTTMRRVFVRFLEEIEDNKKTF